MRSRASLESIASLPDIAPVLCAPIERGSGELRVNKNDVWSTTFHGFRVKIERSVPKPPPAASALLARIGIVRPTPVITTATVSEDLRTSSDHPERVYSNFLLVKFADRELELAMATYMLRGKMQRDVIESMDELETLGECVPILGMTLERTVPWLEAA